jgi:hypothetical protein
LQASATDLNAHLHKFEGMIEAALAKQGRSLRSGAGAVRLGLGSISSCGSSSDLAKDLQLSISPNDPKSGQEYTVDTSYTLDVEVNKGKAYYHATLSGFPIVDQTDDLCEDLSTGTTPCPVGPGYIESHDTSTVPSGVHGSLVATMKWTAIIDGVEKPYLCTESRFSL